MSASSGTTPSSGPDRRPAVGRFDVDIESGHGVQVGDHNIQINHHQAEFHQHFHAAAAVSLARVVRSVYLEQVRRIAPPVLLGRDAELAELAAFYADGERGPYVWWRAGPWVGKSALLSTFVLHAGEGRAGPIWVVSFFITARLAGQDTREAFTTVSSSNWPP